MIDYAAVLSRRHAGREWTLDGDAYEGLTMLDGGSKPTKASLDSAWESVQAEIAAEADAKVASRNSALAKLKVLGLTDAEVAALVGG
jgi:hypothetical protein